MSSAYGPRPNRARKVADTFSEGDTPPAEKKVNTSVWMTVETRQALKVCAATHGTTFSALIEEGAQAVLRKYNDTK
ncbi:MAG: hypothetical protein L0J57_00095 [Brachybacterium sp.]|nr:hypothetical protein [Brachybacterium sp.]